MSAARARLRIDQGGKYQLQLRWLTTDKRTLVPLPDYFPLFSIKEFFTDITPLLQFDPTASSNMTLDDVTDQTIDISINAEQTESALNVDAAFWELKLVPYTASDVGPAGGSYTSLNIDVDNGAGRSVLIASSGTPFASIAADDVIRVRSSENGSEAWRRVETKDSDTQITLLGTLPGTDNTDDEAVILDWIDISSNASYSETETIDLLGGSVAIARDVAETAITPVT